MDFLDGSAVVQGFGGIWQGRMGAIQTECCPSEIRKAASAMRKTSTPMHIYPPQIRIYLSPMRNYLPQLRVAVGYMRVYLSVMRSALIYMRIFLSPMRVFLRDLRIYFI